MTALDLARDWLRYAESDLKTANHMFYDVKPPEIEVSCYPNELVVDETITKIAIEYAQKIFEFCSNLLNQT